MRPFPDRPDVTVAGSWKWCQPGAKALPFPHVFGSQIWDKEEDLFTSPLGEVNGRGGYSKGAADPVLNGSHFCGSPQAFLHGVPFAERNSTILATNGKPCTCGASPSYTVGVSMGFEAAAEVVDGAPVESAASLGFSVEAEVVDGAPVDSAASLGFSVEADVVDGAPVDSAASLGFSVAADVALGVSVSLGVGETYTPTAGITSCLFEVWGGGGSSVLAGSDSAAGGGGGGAYSSDTVTVVYGELYACETDGFDGWIQAQSAPSIRIISAQWGQKNGNGTLDFLLGGAGGDSAAGIGAVRFSGGAGGTSDNSAGGGGGGSAFGGSANGGAGGGGASGAPGAGGAGDGAGGGGGTVATAACAGVDPGGGAGGASLAGSPVGFGNVIGRVTELS